MRDLAGLVDAFGALEVVVVGDALLDGYLWGSTTRLCREAPVPKVTVQRRARVPGGAGNAAVNAAALGARVRLVSVVGDDPDGAELRAALREAGVADDDVLVEPDRQTVAKRRLFAGEQMLVGFDEGAPRPVSAATEAALLDRLIRLLPRADAVVVSDYGYGVLTPRVVDQLGQLHRAHPGVLVVDAHSVTAYRDLRPTAVKPNYDEVRPLLAGCAVQGSREDVVRACADDLLAATGADIVAVTLDRDGAVVCERGRPPHRTYSRPISSARACGAGDSYTAAFAAALAAGADTPSAAELASAAAAVVIAQDGTAVCRADDLREHLLDSSPRMDDLATVRTRVSFHQRQRRRVVFTNGCFDILHRGHVDYLNRAKAMGDVLVVGLNSDESVRRLKGDHRPINPLEDRARVLSALSCVDHLVAFDGDTAAELITALRPDIYVKGGDYTEEMLPEAPLVRAVGGVVEIVPYLEDRSTTAIIDRIRGEASRTSDGLPA